MTHHFIEIISRLTHDFIESIAKENHKIGGLDLGSKLGKKF